VRQNILFVLYLLLSFVLLVGGNDHRIKKASFLSQTIYLPFISSINQIESLFKIKELNIELVRINTQKTNEIVKLENLLNKIKNTRIKYETGNLDFILCDIIGYKGHFQERNLILNKGSKDSITQDLPVISSNGIVGKVVSVSLNTSVVLPLSHSTFRLGVMCKRNHLQGILESDIYGRSYMSLIKLGSDIALGDTIVTSNISTIFPKGYPVGVVKKLTETPDEVYMNASVTTFVEPTSLDQVIVLKYQKDENNE
jgi:rod shape-determining protein MreC